MVKVLRIRGDEVGAVAGVPAEGRLLVVQAAAQEDLLDNVEPLETPRLEVRFKVVLQEPVVDEGLVFLVLEVGRNGAAEELRVFVVEEEVQLVAGVFGVLLSFVGRVQLRPGGDEREFLERGIPAERRALGGGGGGRRLM